MLPSDVRDFAFASLSKDKDVYEWLYFFSEGEEGKASSGDSVPLVQCEKSMNTLSLFPECLTFITFSYSNAMVFLTNYAALKKPL